MHRLRVGSRLIRGQSFGYLSLTRDLRSSLNSCPMISMTRWSCRVSALRPRRAVLTIGTAALRGSMDHIICDPPFLSEECQTKGKIIDILRFQVSVWQKQAAMTVRWLFKSWGATPLPETKLIVCTGERMESLMNKLYRPQGIATTNFEPVHSKGLSNEFFCYANFECESWKWREQKSSS